MNIIRCIITDDEPMAQKGLKGYVDKIPYLQLVSVCENALQLKEVLRHEKPDLVFLDYYSL
jgi:response regulator of citrate/malate metabolism